MMKIKQAAAIYSGIFFAATFSLGLSSYMSVGNGERFKALMLLAVFACTLFGCIVVRLKLPSHTIFYGILFAGVAMRIGYAICCETGIRQHDVWGDNGHFAYIMWLYEKGSLPTSYKAQFYHGPLSHFLIALFMRLVNLVGLDPLRGSWLQVVPCTLSCFPIVYSYQTAKELHLKESVCLATAGLIAFHPAFYQLAASINNDTAMVSFFFLGILYTVKYYEKPTYKNILILAAAIGCSMMSKLSGGTIALFTSPVFLAVLWKRKNPLKAQISQFAAFLALCAPLGLWHPIRNLVVLGQPLGYVPAPSASSDLYLGFHSIGERFLSFPLSQYFGSFCNPRGDYNLWVFLLKSSLFGEWDYNAPWIFINALLLILLVLVLFSLGYMLASLSNSSLHPAIRFGMPLLTLEQLAFFIHFNLGYPFGCTMDFRYIVPVLMPFALYLALAADSLATGNRPVQKASGIVAYGLIAAFCALSVLIYVV